MADNANPIFTNAGVEVQGQLNSQWVASGGATAATDAIANPPIIGSAPAASGLVWSDSMRLWIRGSKIGP